MTLTKEKTTMGALGELLDLASALPRRMDDVETLRFNLQELKQRSRSLAKGDTINGSRYSLTASGVNVEDVMSRLDKLTAKQLRQKASVVPTTAVNKETSSSADNGIDMDIEMTINDDDGFKKFVDSNIQIDWKVRKRELKDKLTGILGKRDASQSLVKEDQAKKPKDLLIQKLQWGNQSIHSRSLISTNFQFIDVKNENNNGLSQPGHSEHMSIKLRKKFESYAEIIYRLNDAREKNDSEFKLCREFIDMNKRNKSNDHQFLESLEIIKHITEDEPLPREILYSYQSEDLTNFNQVKLRSHYVKKSKEYLESQFNKYVNDLYIQSILESQKRVDEISVIDKIIYFINTTLKNDQGQFNVPNITIINEVPIWAVLFYCIRGGFKTEALNFLKKYQDTFNKIEKFFTNYLHEFILMDGKLSSNNWGKINNEFNQYFKMNSKNLDPFKIAIYKIIGKLDLSKKSVENLDFTIEDWVWFQLSLINEDSNLEILSERFSLIDLQKNVISFGKEESTSGFKTNPFYLQTLALVGLNEIAIEYCFNLDEIDCIHLAILFNHYGLLRTGNKPGYLIDQNESGFIKLNFNQLLGYYVKFFKFSDPIVSIEYLLLINEEKIRLNSIKELILESEEFVLLLGKIDSNGYRQGGILEKRRKLLNLSNIDSYLFEICEGGAKRFEFDGKLIQAISLYQLSEQYDTVLKLVNQLLIENFGDEEILKISFNLKKIYDSNVEIKSKINQRNLLNLEKILKFYQLDSKYKEGSASSNCQLILNEIKQLNLIPIGLEQDDITQIRKMALEINQSDECIQKLVPRLLSLTINLLIETKKSQIDGNNLMIFCGLLNYKMPKEIYSKIVSIST